MKNFFFIISGILLLIGVLFLTPVCAVCGCVICNYEPVLESIPANDFFELADSENFVLIDIRTIEEYNSGKIAGATNLDFYSSSFESELDLLDKDKTYLIYCRSGSRSSQALKTMQSLGFMEVYDLKGGIIAWQNSDFPVIFS